jgi:hypothetical protein
MRMESLPGQAAGEEGVRRRHRDRSDAIQSHQLYRSTRLRRIKSE